MTPKSLEEMRIAAINLAVDAIDNAETADAIPAEKTIDAIVAFARSYANQRLENAHGVLRAVKAMLDEDCGQCERLGPKDSHGYHCPGNLIDTYLLAMIEGEQ